MNVDCFAFHADCFAFHAETGQMTADGWPSRYIDAELRGPDPGWIETLFYHRRTLMVENAFNLAVTLPAVWLGVGVGTLAGGASS